MKIPPKVSLQGDERKAETLRGFALSQLRILQKQMSFRGLEQDARKLVFEDGTRISISSVFGTDTVSIYVPEAPVAVAPEEVVAEEELPRVSVFVLGGKHKQGSGRPRVRACADVPELVWPVDKNPTEILKETNLELFVEGGSTEYTWTIVQGEEEKGSKGYWFDEAFTLKEIKVSMNSPGFCDGDAGPNKESCEANGGTWRPDGSTVTLYADETICGKAKIEVVDLCQLKVTGEVPYEKTMKWAETNPTTIDRHDSIVLAVEDGSPPFRWTVEEEGYSFNGEYPVYTMETEEQEIQLFSDVVCSNATLKVIDNCETEIDVELVLDAEALNWPEGFTVPRPCASDVIDLVIEGGAEPFIWSVTDFPLFKLAGAYAEVEGLREMQLTLANGEVCNKVCTIEVIDSCEEVLTFDMPTTTAELYMVWDYEYSDEEIDSPEDNVPVCVNGGAPPYKWVVTPSDDFHLAWPETNGPCNLLSADAGVCGTATITVTDCCGATCEGSVKCTNESHWASKEQWMMTDCGDGCAPSWPNLLCDEYSSVLGGTRFYAPAGGICCRVVMEVTWFCQWGEGPGSTCLQSPPAWDAICSPTGVGCHDFDSPCIPGTEYEKGFINLVFQRWVCD